MPRILAGVKPITIAKEWNQRGIPTVTGAQWRAATVRNIFTNPRICGWRTYQGAILRNESGNPVNGVWEPILTPDEYNDVLAAWITSADKPPSRLGSIGRGYRTVYLLSPFVRCGKCSARMVGIRQRDRNGKLVEKYRCPSKGQGGCGGVFCVASPVNEYIKALVIAEHKKVQLRKMKNTPPWPKTKELADLQARIDDMTRKFEKGKISEKRYWPSLERMEKDEAVLLREKRIYDGQQQARKLVSTDLAKKWDEPDFSMEQKQAAIAQTLSAVVIMSVGKGKRTFNPDERIKPIFR